VSQFFTLSFELRASEAKSKEIVAAVRSYLTGQGAEDILFTHSGDPDDTSEDESDELTAKSRRR